MRQSMLNQKLFVKTLLAIILSWLVLGHCNCLWAKNTDSHLQPSKRLKKKGSVRIATIGPSPLSVNADMAPQKWLRR
jgi:hypothetical protein